MRALIAPVNAGGVATTRVLLLPGAYQQPEDFISAGFADAVRARSLPIDLFFIEPQLAHLTDRSVLQSLREAYLRPARAQGCRAVWILGISLGGMLALGLAQQYADEIEGLCLFAPYLGNRMLTLEIERAHGVRNWKPGVIAADDEERQLWRYVQAFGGMRPLLCLGYGREDRFSAGHRLLAQALPSEQVYVIPGGHDWRTWRALWDNFLDANFRTSIQHRVAP